MSSVNDKDQLPDFEPFLDALFAGTDSSDGDFKKKCEDEKGSIRGIGPKCSLFEEEGNRDIAACFYDEALKLIIELRAYVYPRCQRVVQESLKTNGNTALIEQLNKEIKDKNDEFSDDVDKLPNKCECKDCVWTVTTATRDTETENPDDTPTTTPISTDTTDNTTVNQVGTSSNYGVIPRVFGRYVTAGNIIWVGNQQSEDITYTQQLNDGQVETVSDTVETIDMLVGVAVGPLSRVMRIWISDALVYNVSVNVADGQVELTSTNNAASDLNITALLKDDYDMNRLSAYRPTVEFYTGGKAQHVVGSMADQEGFGRAPAHRGLATLLFKDIDIRLFGDNMPDIRIDVIANEPEDILPELSGTLAGDLVEVDQRSLMAIVQDGSDIVLADYNTLEEQYRYAGVDVDAMLPLVSGAFVTQGTSTVIVDPYRDRDITSLTAEVLGPASVAFLGYDENLFAYDYALLVNPSGAFDILQYDYSNKVASVAGSVSADTGGYTTYAGLISKIDGVITYFKITLNASMDTLRIKRYAMTSGNTLVDFTPAYTAFDIQLDDATDGVRAILDNNDGNIVVLLAGLNKIIKLDKLTLETVWSADAEGVPDSTRGFIGISPYYYYINAYDEVMRLTLADGTLEFVTDLTGSALSGVQYFDGNTGSITFDSTGDDIVRIFPDRYVSAPTSIGAIFDGLIEATNLGYGLIDTTDIQDVTLKGFYIDSAVSLPDIFDTMGELFQVTITDNGAKLLAKKEITISDAVEVDTNDILKDTLNKTRELVAEKYDRVTAKFYDIDDYGLVEMSQSVTLRPDTEEQTYASTDFSLQVYDDATTMRQRLEKVLLRRIAASYKIECEFMPRQLGLSPGDRVSTNGEVFRLSEVVDGATIASSIKGESYDQEDVETDAELASAPTYSGLSVAKPSGALPYKPITLFINALSDTDAMRALNYQIVYTGVDTPERTGITPVQVTTRIDPPDVTQANVTIESTGVLFGATLGLPLSEAYVSTSLTEGVHVGYVTTPPVSIAPHQFVDDAESELVIVFDHAGTEDYFYSAGSVIEHPQKNLLIVGNEIIQFEEWSVGMDGKTITFTKLYRGRFGTEVYMNEHTVGEAAYLYTPETLKPMAVDQSYTTKRNRTRSIISRTSMLGAITVPWMTRAEAGSARPYGPSPVERLEMDDDPSSGALNWHTRRSFSVPLLENGGDLPQRWTYDNEDSLPHEALLIIQLNRIPTFTEWLTEFEEKYYNNQTDYDPTLIYQINLNEDVRPYPIGNMGTDERDPLTQDVFFAVVQLRTYVDPRGYLRKLLGYPTFCVFPPGHYPPYVA